MFRIIVLYSIFRLSSGGVQYSTSLPNFGLMFVIQWNMRKIIPNLFLILLSAGMLVSCKGSQSSGEQEVDQGDSKPYWLSGAGFDQGYYIGVGYALKNSGNYVEIAKKNALEGLISEIKVQVSSSSLLTQIDKDNEFKEEYESTVKTSAAEEIQDFELAGTYEDQSGYWVYYRLSKSKYAAMKAQEEQDAIDLTMQMRKNAISDENAGNLAGALSYYAKGFKSLEKFLGSPTRVDINGETVFLGVDLFTRTQKVMEKLEIEVDPKVVETDRRLDKGLKIRAVVKNTSSGKVEEGIPVRASFAVGGGDVHPSYYSDADGKLTVLVSRIDSRDARQKLKVAVDPSVFIGDKNDQLASMVLQSLVQPKDFVEISIKRPTIFVSTEETVMGKKDPSLSYYPIIKNALTKAGFSLSQSKANSGLSMVISGSLDKGPKSGSTCITYSNLQIAVSESGTGEQIYQGGFSKIKGYSSDYERSARYAYNEGLKVLEDEKIPELINSILK